MKLGLAIGYSGAHLDVPVALVQRAEELGYDSVDHALATQGHCAISSRSAPLGLRSRQTS